MVTRASGQAEHECVPVSEIVSEYMGEGLELAVTPAPQKARLAADMCEVGPLTVVMPPGDYGGPRTIEEELPRLLAPSDSKRPTRVLVGGAPRNPAVRRLAGKLAFPGTIEAKGPEAYLFCAGPDPEVPAGTLIVLAGSSPQADFWAFQTLRQLVATKDGVVYVRRGAIADWPAFPKRGAAHPRPWEHRFKANYSWTYVGSRREFAAVFRDRGAWQMRLETSDFDAPGRLAEIRAGARRAYDRGVREFVLRTDGAGYRRWRRHGAASASDRFAARVKFLAETCSEIERWDPANEVFYMPDHHHTNSIGFPEFVDGIPRAGGLPPGMGLSFCGQDPQSFAIPLDVVTTARRLLGLARSKAQIRDANPRDADLEPFDGRDPRLPEEIDCVFIERGNPLTRITFYDCAWNPAAYDPERSLKLACRELAGGDPVVYRTLSDYVAAWRRERDREVTLAGPEAARGLRASAASLRAAYDALAPHLAASPLAVDSGLARSLVGGGRRSGHSGLEGRERFLETGIRHGFKEARVRRAAGAIAIDASLDDPGWRGAAALGDFVRLGALGDEAVIPDEDQTTLLLAYDDEYLYSATTMRYSERPEIADWATAIARGTRTNGAWRVPCIELFIDPDC
ncbi:MAG: DOMON domain-containing protein, partial [Planctomycetota bacterium]